VSEGLKADAKREGISEEEALARAKKKMPLGRLAEPEEIANIAVFAASERGRFLTGANISADGVSVPTVV
jgi:NAD(P)-dependent dehydrogenase (short-subunit alcohol dehydrogenase family)